jgi:hypothetical protein
MDPLSRIYKTFSQVTFVENHEDRRDAAPAQSPAREQSEENQVRSVYQVRSIPSD